MAQKYAIQSDNGTDSPVTFTADGTSTGAPIRYAYVAVTNLGTTIIYTSTSNTTPGAGTDNTEAIMPNETRVLANNVPYWTQVANVVQAGTRSGGTPGTPLEIQPNGYSLYGQKASPGTNVYVTGTGPWSVEGTG